MKKKWELGQDDFDLLLDWLDKDRNRAGEKYECIRQNLIKFFSCRGCHAPEELTDETINRVTRKLREIIGTYEGDPACYFYGVAKVVLLEYIRTRPVLVTAEPVYIEKEPDEDKDPRYECLERCMSALSPANRALVLDYYKEEKQAKIDFRKEMAEKLGIKGAALRLRAHRIRASLEECVTKCLDHAGGNNETTLCAQ